jgi:hypothetical protein
MLQKGSSEKWPKQLYDLTSSYTMDIQPLLQYFKPLEEFLDTQLINETIGWNAIGICYKFIYNLLIIILLIRSIDFFLKTK